MGKNDDQQGSGIRRAVCLLGKSHGSREPNHDFPASGRRALVGERCWNEKGFWGLNWVEEAGQELQGEADPTLLALSGVHGVGQAQLGPLADGATRDHGAARAASSPAWTPPVVL